MSAQDAPRDIADRVALSARHPIPRITLDTTLSVECQSLILEIAPSILLLGNSLSNAITPTPVGGSEEAPVSVSVPTTPAGVVNHSVSEWYVRCYDCV